MISNTTLNLYGNGILISNDLLYKFWKRFIMEYFGVSTDKEIEVIEKDASMYLGIKLILFIQRDFFEVPINRL